MEVQNPEINDEKDAEREREREREREGQTDEVGERSLQKGKIKKKKIFGKGDIWNHFETECEEKKREKRQTGSEDKESERRNGYALGTFSLSINFFFCLSGLIFSLFFFLRSRYGKEKKKEGQTIIPKTNKKWKKKMGRRKTADTGMKGRTVICFNARSVCGVSSLYFYNHEIKPCFFPSVNIATIYSCPKQVSVLFIKLDSKCD